MSKLARLACCGHLAKLNTDMQTWHLQYRAQVSRVISTQVDVHRVKCLPNSHNALTLITPVRLCFLKLTLRI